MKAEKVLGIVACAVACVASVNAFADQLTWFDGNVGSTTTSGISTPTSASWNNDPSLPIGVTPADGSITLDNDSSTALVLTPSGSEPTLSDNIVTILSTAVLTPSDASDLGDVDGAKAGFAVGVDGANTNFYGYASGLASGSRWVKLSGTVPQGENAPTTFSIVLDYRTGKKNVKFYLGNTQLTDASNSAVKEWNIDSSAASLSNVAAYGSGSLSALSATCEKAVVAIGDVKYGSLVDAIDDHGTAATILSVDPTSGTIGTNESSSGLPVAVCAALGIATTAESPTVAVVPAASDTDTDDITLRLDPNVTVADGVVVKFAVTKDNVAVEGSPFASDAIKIPLTSGTGIYEIKPTVVEKASN